MTGWRLVSDVGGTNARFARADAAYRLNDMRSYPLSAHDSFEAALSVYIAEIGGFSDCLGAAVGAAGPVDDNRVKLTNASWEIDAGRISNALGIVPVRVVNDLEAAAMALPYLSQGDALPFGGGPASERQTATKLAINVGTGFGAASVFVVADGSYLTRPSEAGHMTLAWAEDRERPAFDGCHSIEDVLSGHGLADLHARLCAGTAECPAVDAAEVLQRCKQDTEAARALDLFTHLLGRVCGDLVLANAAWGGVYLFGSVIGGWQTIADQALFQRAFEGQGAMRDRLRGVPTGIVTRGDAPLLGLAHLPIGG